ncbi:hypothetical protein EVB87_177 [Rhizobium phage RHph_N28_1]|nr:hypothetical protein EVB87_177 [Rhizobium phage RHph_N28_1]QIG74206.1 hypothetical protein EVC07_178 [Rhizobium phage RHph_N42]QIG74813.1 hypothetical protein EVC12_178 [Rhizobium phage RHph_I42]QXV73865.1 hypothetical protein [Rhizobium phage RHph_N46]
MKPHIVSYQTLLDAVTASPEIERTILSSSIDGIRKALNANANILTKELYYMVLIQRWPKGGPVQSKEGFPKRAETLDEALDLYNEGW